MGPLAGKVAFVTGAGRGIGRAIAERLHREGARVALGGRDEGPLRAVAASLGEGARAYRLDVRDRAQVDTVFPRAARDLGGLHILVNNAGLGGNTPIDSDDDERWEAIVATNLTGPWICARAAARLIPDRAGGRIVNIASVLGKFGVAGKAAYCASKHGVIGLTRALAVELAPRGISVNAVCPGWVDTEMAVSGMKETAEMLGISYETWRRQSIEAVPLRRFVSPEEVAGMVAYLCRPESEGVTGQALSICGGQTVF
jgi:NAD(P)-dependent dehydrogenase (short-subunit alcohol dehydrogenase family)